MRRIGVYRITHIESGRFYVGHSIDVRKRLLRHTRSLNDGSHHCVRLQRAWSRYGEDAFSIALTRIFRTQEEAAEFEQRELDDHFSAGRLFNSLAVNSPVAAMNEARKKAATPEVQRRRVETARRNGTACAGKRMPIEGFLHAAPELMRFESVNAAGRALGISPTCISLVCRGGRNLTSGYRFWFVSTN